MLIRCDRGNIVGKELRVYTASSITGTRNRFKYHRVNRIFHFQIFIVLTQSTKLISPSVWAAKIL